MTTLTDAERLDAIIAANVQLAAQVALLTARNVALEGAYRQLFVQHVVDKQRALAAGLRIVTTGDRV